QKIAILSMLLISIRLLRMMGLSPSRLTTRVILCHVGTLILSLICSIIASAVAAALFPIEKEKEEQNEI
ncbi:MAG: hypothetical protein IJ731_00600, partial [Eubacterium sp.]|nr:hypothetical protein [Eubacterium sp.]